VGFLLLLAFALRCIALDYQELRGDEAFGYFFSLPKLGDIVARTLELSEPHPVASYWLQHLWLEVAGHSEFALRFLGVCWSVAAVALMLPLASHLSLPRSTGIIAAALMAISPYVIWHAQDARMYSMSLCLTLASTLLALRWWKSTTRSRQLWSALAYLLVTWLALHTHYFALYVVVAQQIAISGWAIASREWRKLVAWWGTGLLLLLLWSPWLLLTWPILRDYGGNGDSPHLVDAMLRALSVYVVGETASPSIQPWWAALALAAVALGLLALWQREGKTGRGAAWFLLIYAFVPLIATWLSALNRPIFNERYLVAALPPVYLLMACAISRYPFVHSQNWTVWLGSVGLIGVLVAMALGLTRHYFDPQYSKTRGWRELAFTLETRTAGVDPMSVRLVQNYPDPTLWYYYQGDVPHLVLPPAPLDRNRSQEEVENMVAAQIERVLLIEQPAESWDPGAIAKDALNAAYTLAGSETVARWPVSIWLRLPTELDPVQVAYEGGLQLTGARITPTRVPSGGMVEVYLRWHGPEASVADEEAVSVQLLNAAGELVAQSDRPLGMASATTASVASYVILVPATLAEGEYQVVVVVYDPSQSATPRRLTTQGTDVFQLGTVVVE
jgi:4-amino-4-deoxy-L-arabinose transferase-like glycosyltransferase